MEEIKMTKKNIAAMNEMEKVSGGMIFDPDRPYPTNLPPGSIAGIPTDTEVIPGGNAIDIQPAAPNSPWPHCGNH